MGKQSSCCTFASCHKHLCRILYALLFIASIPQYIANDLDSRMHQMRQCFNSGYSPQPKHWRHFYEDHLYQGMKLEQMWWSSHKPSVDVTVVTQFSLSRLTNFEDMCSSWGGPVSGVVYVPLIQQQEELDGNSTSILSRAISKVDDMFQRAEANEACQLNIMLVYEVLVDNMTAALYPVNYLRNYALLQAQTELVIFNDVDLLFSNGLLERFQNADEYAAILNACSNDSMAFVFPAFETTRSRQSMEEKLKISKDAVTGTKDELGELQEDNQVQQFHAVVRRGHGATDYEHWFGSTEPYMVDFTFGYEPWYMASRHHVPFYDLRLRGYGMNKAVQSYHAFRLGVKFYVWPHNWIFHQPHRSTPSQKLFTSKRNDTELSLFKINAQITTGIVRSIRTRIYIPTLDTASLNCIQALDWWRGNDWVEAYERDMRTPSPPPPPAAPILQAGAMHDAQLGPMDEPASVPV